MSSAGHVEQTASQGVDRRRLVAAATWAAPAVMVGTAAPAYAASTPPLGINFDGGTGANGLYNVMYFNLGVASGYPVPFTLTRDVVITLDVVGLLTNARGERNFSATSSDGRIQRSSYDSTTRTTTITWTVPAGSVLPVEGTATANRDILFTFQDGGTVYGRITNKVVVRSITGAAIASPSSVPIDSSVVGDINGSRVSADGIY